LGTYKVPLAPSRYSSASFPEKICDYMYLRRQEKHMSAPLIVSIPHQLGREEAIRRLRGGLTRAAASFPVLKVDEERWEENGMMFRVRAMGQAASGHLEVEDDHVRLEVTLPWLLQRFAEAAKAAISKRGNLLLTKR
jgi:Putative polyhydroxyalkanoic acid system protein (PHA_gran_rgn)